MQNKVVNSLREAIQLAGLKSGMSISFHHHLRNGDYTLNMVMEEIAAFAPAAIAAAERVLSFLEEARHWMQEDVRYKGVRPNNRKMECLAEAAANAKRLVEILNMLPEGCASAGGYLRSPEGYVDAVTTEYAKLDRLNNAVNQVRETRNQLRMLQ